MRCSFEGTIATFSGSDMDHFVSCTGRTESEPAGWDAAAVVWGLGPGGRNGMAAARSTIAAAAAVAAVIRNFRRLCRPSAPDHARPGYALESMDSASISRAARTSSAVTCSDDSLCRFSVMVARVPVGGLHALAQVFDGGGCSGLYGAFCTAHCFGGPADGHSPQEPARDGLSLSRRQVSQGG